MGESVYDLYRAKIRLGEFKAVYIITLMHVTAHHSLGYFVDLKMRPVRYWQIWSGELMSYPNVSTVVFVNDCAFMLYIGISWDKTFHTISKCFNIVTMTLKFDLLSYWSYM